MLTQNERAASDKLAPGVVTIAVIKIGCEWDDDVSLASRHDQSVVASLVDPDHFDVADGYMLSGGCSR